MPKLLVNLDALIEREDFDARADRPDDREVVPSFRVSDLERGSLLSLALRKPDFQRETAHWRPSTIAEMIQSFVDGDTIPSVILWRSPNNGNVFVIDGAHRLSALMAWVRDDYGDGPQSQDFFQGRIPQEQLRAAEKTRQLVSQIGTYAELSRAAKAPHPSLPPQIVARAKTLGVTPINLQWVKGDTQKAEQSFFKINQQGAPIDATEWLMIEARDKPIAIATRALLRAGGGHKYWVKFSADARQQVESLAAEIAALMFEPQLKEPIRTLDLPPAGPGYSGDAVRLLAEFVSIANGVIIDKHGVGAARRKAPVYEATQQPIEIDTDGQATLRYLKNVRRLASRIAGDEPRSLGLHPAVYFYGDTGKFQAAAYLAIVRLFQGFELERDGFLKFTSLRRAFEEFLVAHRHLPTAIVNRYGGGTRRVDAFLALFSTVLDGVRAGRDEETIRRTVADHPKLKFLREAASTSGEYGSEFAKSTKVLTFLREALSAAAPRCAFCKARIDAGKSMTVDHDTPKRDGGDGSPENARLMHPFCNSGAKESQQARSAHKANDERS
jgi:hypothetical protein